MAALKPKISLFYLRDIEATKRSVKFKVMRKLLNLFTVALGSSFFLPQFSSACDRHAIYTAVESGESKANSLRLGIAEQFSYFGKIQNSGKVVDNVASQHMQSSITQVFASYDITDSVGLQLTLPFISRSFRRYEDSAIQRGSESGIGDLSLLAKFAPFAERNAEWGYRADVFFGIKLPTGDSDRIKEELSEGHGENHSENHGENHSAGHGAGPKHTEEMMVNAHSDIEHGGATGESGISSAIHGHDLALGSGSVDFPLGASFFVNDGRAFLTTELQYVLRTEGESNYRYANDLLWEAGSGYFVLLNHDFSIAIKANLSGEYKRKDSLDGERQSDTGIRSIFAGPEIQVKCGAWNGELAWDIPLDVNNTGIQAVPEYKLRAALNYLF